MLEASRVEGSDKLLQLKLDLGDEQRNVFSGISANYTPEDLVGRYVVMIANLAPRKMRFGVSEGMVLCASGERRCGGVFLLSADAGVHARHEDQLIRGPRSGDLRRIARRESRAAQRAGVFHALRAAGRRDPLRPGHGPQREHRHPAPVSQGQHPAGHPRRWGSRDWRPYIRHIGLYNAKAKNVVECCRLLIERHGGEVPRDREALEDLPGVGRKTANVVLNVAFGEPDAGRGYACVPRRQPHRAGQGKDSTGRGAASC